MLVAALLTIAKPGKCMYAWTKDIAVYGILLTSQKEQANYPCNNMGKAQRRYVERK